jgi:hypothetical protein
MVGAPENDQTVFASGAAEQGHGSCTSFIFACTRRVPERSVTVKLDQALVADTEVVGDFMEHNPSYFAAKRLRLMSVESDERTAENRDLVRQDRAVIAAAPSERDALIEAKQRLA